MTLRLQKSENLNDYVDINIAFGYLTMNGNDGKYPCVRFVRDIDSTRYEEIKIEDYYLIHLFDD